jgi:hypothetical protein
MLRRNMGAAALVLSVVALVMTTTGIADAARKAVRGQVVRLSSTHRIASKYLPTVARARSADRLGTLKADDLTDGCNPKTVDMGTWCLMSAPYEIQAADAGKNDYFYATQKCTELGGYLPSAGQLIGAAARVRLSSVLTDDAGKALIDDDPTDGTKDWREMSSTLITTAAGSSAAGSQGVSVGAKGNPRTGEPDPVPQPANAAPDTLQYVTVYDNGDHGGFAGSQPVSDTQRFRCAFGKTQGQESAPSDSAAPADSSGAGASGSTGASGSASG